MATMTIAEKDVQTEKGRLFVTCTCGERKYLGPWDAAHVGSYELSSPCAKCGDMIVIERSEPDED